jgi:methyl-accepting chemotaxis protein
VLRPLRRLRTATAGIAGEGDLERRVPVAGPPELRDLADSFNAKLVRLARSATIAAGRWRPRAASRPTPGTSCARR